MFYVVRAHRLLLAALALAVAAAAAVAYCRAWLWDQPDGLVPVRPGDIDLRPARTGQPTAGLRPPTAETVFAVAVGMLLSYLLGRSLRRWRARGAGRT